MDITAKTHTVDVQAWELLHIPRKQSIIYRNGSSLERAVVLSRIHLKVFSVPKKTRPLPFFPRCSETEFLLLAQLCHLSKRLRSRGVLMAKSCCRIIAFDMKLKEHWYDWRDPRQIFKFLFTKSWKSINRHRLNFWNQWSQSKIWLFT